MLAQMTAREFTEWQEYCVVEPFLADRTELMLAQLTSLMANVNRDSKKRRDPYTAADFMLDTRSQTERQIDDMKRIQAKNYFDQLVARAKAKKSGSVPTPPQNGSGKERPREDE